MKLKLDVAKRTDPKGGIAGAKKRMGAKLGRPSRVGALLLFALFLFLAAVLWLITASNNEKNSRVEVTFPLKYENLTGEYAFEAEPPLEVEVKLSVTGLALLRYSLWPVRDSLSLFVTQEEIQKKRFRVSETLMKERIASQLPGSINILSISPSSIAIPLYRRASKTVPVVQEILADERSGYLLFPIRVEPSSVTIYGTQKSLDTVKAVHTAPVMLQDIHQSQTLLVALKPMVGVYFAVDSVKAQIHVEELTEQSMELPITVINEPSHYRVKPLPATVTLQIVVPSSWYNRYMPEEFEAIVDYNDILPLGEEASNDLLEVVLRRLPETISRYSLSPSRVQFILEERKSA